MKHLTPLRLAGLGVFATLWLLASGPADALQSDSKAAITIDANKMTYSEKNSINVFSGNVLLTRGSLIIRGDKLTLTQRPDGTQFARVEGNPARFRQQRDSGSSDVLMINGSGSTIEFDGKTATVTFSGKANIQKTTNGELTEEISGSKIVYEQNTEFLSVTGSTADNSGNTPRVQAVIKPRKE